MTTSKALKSGAIGAAPAIGGSLFLGPTLGAPIGGFVADKFTEGGGTKFTKAGVAIGVASLFVMNAGATGSGSGGVM